MKRGVGVIDDQQAGKMSQAFNGQFIHSPLNGLRSTALSSPPPVKNSCACNADKGARLMGIIWIDIPNRLRQRS